MYLAYFDENKYSEENPFFVIGGYLMPDDNALGLEAALTKIQLDFLKESLIESEIPCGTGMCRQNR